MKQLFEDLDAEQENLAREFDAREELARITDELDLFQHPLWHIFAERLNGYVNTDMNALVNCEMEEVAPTRARIKAHRHLLGLEQTLRGRGAELRSLLAGDPEEEDDDD